MFSRSATAMLRAITQLFRNWPAMAIMIATYSALLAGGYLFVTTKEATPTQVIITIGLALLTPALFFVLQTVAVGYATGPRPSSLVARSIKNSWKLIIVSLPVILITALGFYLLARIQNYFSLSNNLVEVATTPSAATESLKTSSKIGLLISTLRYLLLGVFAPLALIQVWIATEHNGLLLTLRRFLRHLTQAFAARTVLIYVLGFFVFAFVPYLILFKTITVNGAWMEIGFFVTRLNVVFSLTLFGWVVTVGTLALVEQSDSKTSNPQITHPGNEVRTVTR